MRARVLPILVVVAVSIVSIPGYAEDISATEAKKIASGDEFNQAWDKGDSKALGSLFTEDAMFVTPGGIEVGREAIEKNLAMRAGKSVHTATVDQVRPLSADTFWAAGSWKNEGKNGEPTFTGYWSQTTLTRATSGKSGCLRST
jgi:ketosteroid isomerase-like protein